MNKVCILPLFCLFSLLPGSARCQSQSRGWNWAQRDYNESSPFYSKTSFDSPFLLPEQFVNRVTSLRPKLVRSRDREREWGPPPPRNHFIREPPPEYKINDQLDQLVRRLERQFRELNVSMDTANHRIRDIEIQQQQLRLVSKTDESKTIKLINRLHFADKCGGLVELSQSTELSYVRPSDLDDVQNDPETCVWVLVTSTHNKVGITLKGLEEPLIIYKSDVEGEDNVNRISLTAQVIDPNSDLKPLGSRDVDREYIAPSPVVLLIFSTINSTHEDQGFRLSLRNVDKKTRKKTSSGSGRGLEESHEIVTVHTEWNLLGEKGAKSRSLTYPFGGGMYSNKTSVYFLFQPGPNRRVWLSVSDFEKVESHHSALAVYKYSAELKEFGQIARLEHEKHGVVDRENKRWRPDYDHQHYMGHSNQPVLIYLNSNLTGWGQEFTISFSYQLTGS